MSPESNGKDENEDAPFGAGPYGTGDASYHAAGEFDGVKRLVGAFYDLMDSDPDAAVIRAMHPGDLTVARDKLTRFLCGWLGGPKLFSQKYGPIAIPRAHAHLDIGYPERDAWLGCMKGAIDQQPFDPAFKTYLYEQLCVPAERSRQVAAAAAEARAKRDAT